MLVDIQKVSELCKRYHGAEVEDRIKIADDVCERRFVFTLRWDMEQTVEPVQFTGDILWEHQPKEDLEWTVMLNRQRYLLCLAQAYALTGAPKYLECYLATVESFIDSTPLAGSQGKNPWRTLDAGIRINNWAQSLNILESCGPLPQPFLDKVYESLGVHIQYLLGCYDVTHYMSNWGVLVNAGLVAAILYLDSKGMTAYTPQLATICEQLEEQIEVQVLADGVQWEQSPMYHHEVLWCYLETIELLRRKLPISPRIISKTLDMCYATLYSAKPNHHQLLRSDSDDTDVRDVLTLGAFLFRDGQLKYGGYPRLDFDNLWRLDAPAQELYHSIKARQPAHTSRAMDSSGNYYLRTDWSEAATLLAFRCGPIGNSHGHVDLLHIDLFAGGEDILMDSGRLTYVNGESRLALKSQFAHNTLTVDGKPFTDCVGSWQYGKVAHPLKGQVWEDDQYYYASGGHLGYLAEGVFVRRQLVCIKPDIVVIFDSFYTGGPHRYTQQFHFGGDASFTLDGSSVRWQSKKNRAVLLSLGVQPQIELSRCLLSRWYNQESQGHCATITHEFPATAGIITVLGVNPLPDFSAQSLPVLQAREERLLSPDTAQAVGITNGGRHYTLIFSLNDPVGGINLLRAGDCIGYGEVLAFDEHQKRTVLAN